MPPSAGERLGARARAAEALRRRDARRDAVRQRGGALVLGALADLAAVAVVGGQGQVGVKIALAEVEGPVGVLEDLRGEGGEPRLLSSETN